MKNLIILAIGLTLISCTKESDKPVVVPPIVEPPQAPQIEEYCKADGKQFSCMSALYFYGKECPSSTPVYVKDLEEMRELVQKTSQAVNIKMKDGSSLKLGVGFAMPCEEI